MFRGTNFAALKLKHVWLESQCASRTRHALAKIEQFLLDLMFPSSLCSATSGSDWRQQHQKRKLDMLRFWRDGLERQLAAVNASLATLEGQISRDSETSD